jgi:hypothetical protein
VRERAEAERTRRRLQAGRVAARGRAAGVGGRARVHGLAGAVQDEHVRVLEVVESAWRDGSASPQQAKDEH